MYQVGSEASTDTVDNSGTIRGLVDGRLRVDDRSNGFVDNRVLAPTSYGVDSDAEGEIAVNSHEEIYARSYEHDVEGCICLRSVLGS